MKDFTHREALLIELVHFLAYGSDDKMGYSIREVMDFLDSRVKSRDNIKILDLLDMEGRAIIDELKQKSKELELLQPTSSKSKSNSSKS